MYCRVHPAAQAQRSLGAAHGAHAHPGTRPKPSLKHRHQAVAVERSVSVSPELQQVVSTLDVANTASPTGHTTVHILAISHVSAKSCDQIRELIGGVKPDVVMVELCKDRLGLLATSPPEDARVWHTPRVFINGLRESPGYPTVQELSSLLTCKPGRPVSAEDIEDDVRILEATGLFRAVRPRALSSKGQDAPLFIVTAPQHGAADPSELTLTTVPPLNRVEFRCEPRVLPRILDFQARVSSAAAAAGVTIAPGDLECICEATRESANVQNADTLDILMAARAQLLYETAFVVPVDVVFKGVNEGNVEAVVTLRDGAVPRTGLEESAEGGRGPGIQTFQNPNRGEDIQVCLKSKLPASVVERMAQQQSVTLAGTVLSDNAAVATGVADGDTADVLPGQQSAALAAGVGRSKWRPWTTEEQESSGPDRPPPQPLKDLLAETLVSSYADLQAQAGDNAGVEVGQPWRVAMEEAMRCGAAQFLLGDRPVVVTQRRIAQGLWDALAPRALLGIVGLNASVLAGTFSLIPDDLSVRLAGGSVLLAAGLCWPLVAPLLEVWNFSKQSGEQVEETVALKEPIAENLDQEVKVYGEDALLDWPGARTAVISERDRFMGKTLWQAATGGRGTAPAFVLDSVDGYTALRYMGADEAPEMASPVGCGDGAYKPLNDAQNIVAVIGSAHVRGISRDWESTIPRTDVKTVLKS